MPANNPGGYPGMPRRQAEALAKKKGEEKARKAKKVKKKASNKKLA